MQITVRDLMTRNVATLRSDATLADARRLLARRSAAEVYILEPGRRLIGVVPNYEILKAHLAGLDPQTPIRSLMSCNCPTITAGANVAEAAVILRDSCNRRLAVLSRGRFVGHVRRGDVLRLLLMLEQMGCALAPEPKPKTQPALPSRPSVRQPQFLKERPMVGAELPMSDTAGC